MERIRQLRKERGLSQAKLAVMADMDPATLNRLERGTGNPNLKTLERVAEALEVEVADFFPKTQRRSSLEPSLFNGLEDERRDYGSHVRQRINLLKGQAEVWQRFIDKGLYDLKRLDLETLKVVDRVSLEIVLNHGREAAAMKRVSMDEQRTRLEQAERRLIDTNLEFWAHVEDQLAREKVSNLNDFRKQREQWNQARNSRTA
jgi:transcriptional regulator with XRE-family HTH domain